MPRRFCTGPLIFCVLLRRRLLGDCANSPENRLGQAQPASAMLAKLENLPTARGQNRRGRNPVEEWKRFAALRGKFGKERETGAMAENTKDSFLMTLEGGEGEIVEKKSRTTAQQNRAVTLSHGGYARHLCVSKQDTHTG